MADEDSGFSKILQTRSHARLDKEDFDRFSSVFVRAAIFFKAGTNFIQKSDDRKSDDSSSSE